jgi:acetoin utilization deacetylase AcuC-like enzyme
VGWVEQVNKTGVFYNPFLEKHLQDVPHVEQFLRTRNTFDKLKKLLDGRVEFFISDSKVNLNVLSLTHDEGYIDKILSLSGVESEVFLDPDTVVAKDSVECALLSAGLVVEATEKVMSGELTNAFVLSRPPGHHATKNRAMGFCMFNNVAVAANFLINEYNLSRIAIVDFDVHHGNGTQDIFYDTDKVLYISTHQFPFYPGTGYFNQIGTKDGIGFTVNLPMPSGAGDEDFALVYGEIVQKVLRKFEPEFIIVSAGFDAHFSDPLGGMNLTDLGFKNIANIILKSSPNSKVVFALEGGYNVDTLPGTVYTVIEELIVTTSEPVIKVTGTTPIFERVVEEFSKYINDYWNLF